MTHAMRAFEIFGIPSQVASQFGLHALQIVGVQELPPVRWRLVIVIEPEHHLPARREVSDFGLGVKIPQAIVGTEQREIVALFQIGKMPRVVRAF